MQTRYGFRNCVGGYFEMPTADARKILPLHLQPVEMQHTRSVLALTAFEFTDSEVGPYDEVVFAVVVPPKVQPGKALAKAAFYPFCVGTSTEASRLHAIERWHLPHFMKNVDIAFSESDGLMDVQVRDDGRPVVDFSVTERLFEPTRNLYTAFMTDSGGRFKADIYMQAPHSEHEEERGSLTLYEHEMTAPLALADVNTYPFREEWYRAGTQIFDPLETL